MYTVDQTRPDIRTTPVVWTGDTSSDHDGVSPVPRIPISRMQLRLAISACRLSYHSEGTLDGWECEYVHESSTDTDFWVCRKSGTSNVLVAFRGTSSLADMRTDRNIQAVETVYGKVHAGLENAYNSVRNTIIRVRPNIVVGHSLGAALAIRCAVEYQSRPFPSVAVVFGCPRMFSSEFVQQYYAPTVSIVAKGDIVSRIPRFLYGKWGFIRYPVCRTCVPGAPYVVDETGIRAGVDKSAIRLFSHKLSNYAGLTSNV